MPEDTPLLMIPGPIELSPAVSAAMAGRTRGHLEPAFVSCFGKALKMMREVWLAGPDAQPFVVAGSGTLAMEITAQNLIDEGDAVVVVETGYFSERMAEILRRRGAQVSMVHAEAGDAPTTDQLRTMLATQPHPVAVFATHVDTSTGVRVDAKAIAQIANEYGAMVVLDGVCAVGGEALEMQAWGVDVALTASQKAIGLPPGLALLVASKRALARRAALQRSPSLALDFAAWQPIMQAYEAGTTSYFATPATNLVVALEVGLGELLAESNSAATAMALRLREHERAASAVRKGLSCYGLAFVPRSPELMANTLTACYLPEGIGPELVAGIAKHGVVVAGGLHPAIRTRSFRIGHMGHSSRTPQHLLRCVEAVGLALKGLGKEVDQVSASRAVLSELD